MAIIRTMRFEDIEAAANVYVKSWQAGYRGLVDSDYLDALTPERWSGVFREGFGRPDAPNGLVLSDHDNIIGVSHFSATRDEDLPDGYGEIISLYLLPDHWGNGLGSTLLAAALNTLKEQGFSDACLWSLYDNDRAQRAYLRAGFQPDGAEKDVDIGGKAYPCIRFTRHL